MSSPGPHIRTIARGTLMAALLVVVLGARSFGQVSLVADSPFAASGASASGNAAQAKDYELAGSSMAGSDVSVCIFERQAKRSEWIPVGGSSNGIKVISFDQMHDTAVVIVSGQRREISMRTASVASLPSAAPARTAMIDSAPAAPLVPVGDSPPAAVGTPEQQQREARMLVSDLLEIGVQQRKAYQDAKAKAAQSGTTAPAN